MQRKVFALLSIVVLLTSLLTIAPVAASSDSGSYDGPDLAPKEDNLPDPWSNPIITRIQRAMNPVAVADVAYWNANRLSDASGKWPASVEAVSKGAKLTRQLVVFNDAFSGTTVDVAWEMHAGTADGEISDQGKVQLDIPLGSRKTTSISVTAPASGTAAVLVLESSKGGSVIFRDDGQVFKLQ